MYDDEDDEDEDEDDGYDSGFEDADSEIIIANAISGHFPSPARPFHVHSEYNLCW